jgi:hypothetical protein
LFHLEFREYIFLDRIQLFFGAGFRILAQVERN